MATRRRWSGSSLESKSSGISSSPLLGYSATQLRSFVHCCGGDSSGHASPTLMACSAPRMQHATLPCNTAVEAAPSRMPLICLCTSQCASPARPPRWKQSAQPWGTQAVPLACLDLCTKPCSVDMLRPCVQHAQQTVHTKALPHTPGSICFLRLLGPPRPPELRERPLPLGLAMFRFRSGRPAGTGTAVSMSATRPLDTASLNSTSASCMPCTARLLVWGRLWVQGLGCMGWDCMNVCRAAAAVGVAEDGQVLRAGLAVPSSG